MRETRLRWRRRVWALPWLQSSPGVADRIPRRLRALDLAVVVLVAPLALVVGSALALAVLIDSPGPILYRASRIGRGGRPFEMLKFRTMRHGAAGPSLSAKGDNRYTPLGRSLAASRFDELPQLVNVLKGDMRLVGPRPEAREFVEAFPLEYERILSVPPGVTGPAQLHFATEGRLLAGVDDRAAYYRTHVLPLKVGIDLAYAQRHGALGDLKVLLLTPLLPLQQVAVALATALRMRSAGSRAPTAIRALPALALVLATALMAGLLIAEAALTPL